MQWAFCLIGEEGCVGAFGEGGLRCSKCSGRVCWVSGILAAVVHLLSGLSTSTASAVDPAGIYASIRQRAVFTLYIYLFFNLNDGSHIHFAATLTLLAQSNHLYSFLLFLHCLVLKGHICFDLQRKMLEGCLNTTSILWTKGSTYFECFCNHTFSILFCPGSLLPVSYLICTWCWLSWIQKLLIGWDSNAWTNKRNISIFE